MTRTGKRKNTSQTRLYGPVSFLVICLALILGMSIFFRVAGISVEGNSLYTDDQVVEATGIEVGDNLFFIDRIAAVSRLKTRLPYVENAAIRRSLPNRVEITVSESKAMAYVRSYNEFWAIDRGCKLLSAVTEAEAERLIPVTGLEAEAPEVGQTLAVKDSEAGKVAFLMDILRQISLLGIAGDVSEINMSDISCPTFSYLGRFTVRLGADANIDYKFQLLKSAVEKLMPGDSGTLDLSIDERAHLIQD